MIDWGHWYNEPLFVRILVAAAWAYALAAGPFRSRIAPGQPYPVGASLRFGAGLLVAYLAVGAPWERVGRYYLFSAGVGLDMLLLYPAAGLILSGLPGWLIDAPLRRPAIRAAARVLLHPVVCGALYIALVSGGYSPLIREPALHHDQSLAFEHLAYLAAGLLFWWPIASPSRLLPRLRFGPRCLYLFAAEVALTGAFTYLLMAEHPMYPTYALAPRAVASLTPEDDQLMGGVVLSAVSSLVMVVALGAAFYNSFKASEKATTGRGKNIPARP